MGATITTPTKRLGAWLARANDTIYQAACDGFVCGYSLAGIGACTSLTDAATPPTVIRGTNYTGVDGTPRDAPTPVKKNDYWKVTGATVVFWIPLGP